MSDEDEEQRAASHKMKKAKSLSERPTQVAPIYAGPTTAPAMQVAPIYNAGPDPWDSMATASVAPAWAL